MQAVTQIRKKSDMKFKRAATTSSSRGLTYTLNYDTTKTKRERESLDVKPRKKQGVICHAERGDYSMAGLLITVQTRYHQD